MNPADGPRTVLISATLAALCAAHANAADLGGDCCADLEERIAVLESTTARKGNRKVSLTVTGAVNKAILAWDDGKETNAYIVGNKNDQSNFSFVGEAGIAKGWKAGYEILIRLEDTLSDAVDQATDSPPSGFTFWQLHWWIENDKLGKISVGRASRVSDTAPEVDLSETGLAGYAGVQDVGGGFLFRRRDGALGALTWGDVYNHINGDTADIVRWDSPTVAGFSVAASWGEDDIWDVGARYSGNAAGFVVEGAIAYTESSDENGIDGGGDTPNSTIVGSAAVLHEPTGLNFAAAAGYRDFNAPVEDADSEFRTPADARFIYVKLGWLANLNNLGPTGFYGEYGHFKNYVSAGVDEEGVASLSLTGVANVCAGAGDACRVTGSDAEVWGFGAVQHIESAEMQVYIGWRRHSAAFDLVDVTGAAVTEAGVEDFDTLIAGAKISF
jgi:hypothetical protein